MSVFGGTLTAQPKSIFGSTNTSQPTQTGGLFGQPQAQQPQSTGTGLFGSLTTQAQQQRPALSLFGASTQPTATSTSNLFGAAQPQQQTGSNHFGGQTQQQTGTGLFNNAQQKPTLSLFGGSTTQQAPVGSTGNLFGASQQQQQPQQQNGLFGGLGQSTNTQPQQQQGGLFGSVAPNASINNTASQTGQQALGNSSIWTPGQNITPREKSVPDQMQILAQKWDPTSPSCPFNHYFYNRVPEEQVPYYAPGPAEDATKWEEALKNKPSANVIPVLAQGPLALGRRLEIQAMTIRALQAKLHELNEVLTKRLQAHDLQYSVRAQEARRKHVVLSRRCLALATKAQVLRNRGYALDGTEEQLRLKLNMLEKIAFDPMLSGRQEEIWAKMSVLRDRAQILKTETERLSKDMSAGKENPLDDDQMKKIEKLLGIYEMQLNQLKRERETAEKDLIEWQGATTQPNR